MCARACVGFLLPMVCLLLPRSSHVGLEDDANDPPLLVIALVFVD